MCSSDLDDGRRMRDDSQDLTQQSIAFGDRARGEPARWIAGNLNVAGGAAQPPAISVGLHENTPRAQARGHSPGWPVSSWSESSALTWRELLCVIQTGRNARDAPPPENGCRSSKPERREQRACMKAPIIVWRSGTSGVWLGREILGGWIDCRQAKRK